MTTKTIHDEILKDESMEIEVNHYGGLEVYHNGVYTDMIITDGENLEEEVATVTFNNGRSGLQLSLPILDEVIGTLYHRVNY